jgi:hypothetical protein
MRIYLIYGLWVLVGVLLLRTWAQWQGDRRWPLARMLFVGWAIALGWLLWHGPEPYRLFGDFTKAYYFAGQQVLQGSRDFYGEACVRGYVNIPIVAPLFAPFALVEAPVAGWLMAAVGVAATVAACYGTIRLAAVRGVKTWAVVALFIACGPVYYNLRLGNTTQYVLVLLVLALACWRRGWAGWTGALVAIAGVIKIPILLLGGYFLLRAPGLPGRWRAWTGFVVGLTSVVGLSLLLFGIDLHGAWYSQCIQPFAGKPLSAFNVQSVDGVLARLLGGEPDTWIPLVLQGPAALLFKLLRYGLLALLVGATGWVLWRVKSPLGLARQGSPQAQMAAELELMAVLCVALLISPISWTHYYLLLLLPIALLLGNPWLIPPGWRWALGVAVVLICLPVTLYQPTGVPEGGLALVVLALWPVVGLSHYFVGGVLLLGTVLAARSHPSAGFGPVDPRPAERLVQRDLL